MAVEDFRHEATTSQLRHHSLRFVTRTGGIGVPRHHTVSRLFCSIEKSDSPRDGWIVAGYLQPELHQKIYAYRKLRCCSFCITRPYTLSIFHSCN